MRKSMTEQLSQILDDSISTIKKNTDDDFKVVASASVDALKAKSPHKTGKYAQGWTYKAINDGGLKGYIVYNATSYQLTHLLENGHAKRNGGRVRARRHIQPVEILGIEKLTRMLQNVAR